METRNIDCTSLADSPANRFGLGTGLFLISTGQLAILCLLPLGDRFHDSCQAYEHGNQDVLAYNLAVISNSLLFFGGSAAVALGASLWNCGKGLSFFKCSSARNNKGAELEGVTEETGLRLN